MVTSRQPESSNSGLAQPCDSPWSAWIFGVILLHPLRQQNRKRADVFRITLPGGDGFFGRPGKERIAGQRLAGCPRLGRRAAHRRMHDSHRHVQCLAEIPGIVIRCRRPIRHRLGIGQHPVRAWDVLLRLNLASCWHVQQTQLRIGRIGDVRRGHLPDAAHIENPCSIAPTPATPRPRARRGGRYRQLSIHAARALASSGSSVSIATCRLASAFAVLFCSANSTVTSSPGFAQPQTGTGIALQYHVIGENISEPKLGCTHRGQRCKQQYDEEWENAFHDSESSFTVGGIPATCRHSPMLTRSLSVISKRLALPWRAG